MTIKFKKLKKRLKVILKPDYVGVKDKENETQVGVEVDPVEEEVKLELKVKFD